MAYPTVYPTGTTLYDPERCFNGFTVYEAKEQGVLIMDMNGHEIQFFKGLHGFPPKLLPGGHLLAQTGERNTRFSTQDKFDLVQVDWDGNIVWKFNQYEYIEDPGETPCWMARQHHDFQREGNPVGYYAPGMAPRVDGGNTLILGHKDVHNPRITNRLMLDDTVYEIDWEGNLLWEWVLSEHFDEIGLREDSKNTLFRNPNVRPARGGLADWAHTNSMSLLGPNRHYEAGDERFHPDNIIICCRDLNTTLIISKRTGRIVWKMGPYYDETAELRAIGWIIGQHHAHMIPRGLVGEGNIMVFDNGGWAGYGSPNPASVNGEKYATRDYSRVLEINPVSMKIEWQFTPKELGKVFPVDYNRFYSPFVSGAQRLPNGNTLITEGASGMLLEVTRDHQLVWEYISPYWGGIVPINQVYRAYRVPYAWIPQAAEPEQTAIPPIDVRDFRMPGAAARGADRVVEVEGCNPFFGGSGVCVVTDVEENAS
ncbi:aryl-sulfate sulfotransferase [Desulfovibrio sp. SGI.169]|uniref:aryl-sulfate sulfotransferase n=1 Tax=Desulfovibrio sp. SGI.169 TaxID=3420561 RepID=UPI003D015EF6